MGAALVVISALGYATNPIFGKFAYQAGATPITLGIIRFVLADIALWLLVAFGRRKEPISMRQSLQLIALGMLGAGPVTMLYFIALQHIGASLATGIFYTYPAMAAIVGLVRGERMGPIGYGGLALTVGGTWLLLGNNFSGFSWWGAALILASAVLYTAYMFVGAKMTQGFSPFVVSAHVTAGCAAIFLVVGAGTGQPMPGVGAILSGAALAFCATIVALTAFFAGLAAVGPTRAAIISTLEPVFTSILAVLFLDERLGMLQVLGIGLVALGAVAAQMRGHVSTVTEQV